MVLSVVIPVYFGADILPLLVSKIKENCLDIVVLKEIILVDDRSPDNSWEKIIELKNKNSEITGIRLSRNFGQHKAIMAGLEHVTGEWVVVMDCDLQDDPANIPIFLNEQNKVPADGIVASRLNRTDSFLKKKTSLLFYRVFYYLTGVKQDPSVANFGLYNIKVINAIKKIGADDPFFPFLITWAGFNIRKVDVSHGQRHSGKSSYSWVKLLKLAIKVVLTNSNKPLHFAIKLGFSVSIISFGMVFYTLYQWAVGDILVLGFASLMASIWFLSGVLISLLGIVSLYLGKVYDNTKLRPTYIIDETI